jgi:hypothetical protein
VRPAPALLALLAAAALTACSSGTPAPDPSGIDGVREVTVVEQTSADRHTTDRVASYSATPPAGGKHWPATSEVAPGVLGWLRCAVYDRPVPPEFAVHSQEHGAVWLTYRPGAAPADVAAFAALAEVRPDYVIVSPYAGQPSGWTASTWGYQLAVDEPDDSRLRQFVERFSGGGQGGEAGADCAGGSTPEAAEAALAAANPERQPSPGT